MQVRWLVNVDLGIEIEERGRRRASDRAYMWTKRCAWGGKLVAGNLIRVVWKAPDCACTDPTLGRPSRHGDS